MAARRRAQENTPQRQAHRAGATGNSLTPRLASMAETDPSIDAAHDAGRNGTDFDEWHSSYRPPERHQPRAPRRPEPEPSSAPESAPSRSGTSGGGFKVSDVADDASGLLLGAIAYALVLSLITQGAKGPAMWFKAKFLNETSAQPSGSPDPLNSQAQSAAGEASGAATSSVTVTPATVPIPAPAAAAASAAAVS